MSDAKYPITVNVSDAPPRAKPSNYPEPFASRMLGREKRPLGDLFGLTNFGVNFVRLAAGASSSLRHAHTAQDEFILVLRGSPTLHTDEGRTRLSPGMCAGFKANSGNAHCLINEASEEVVYLEVGDRTPGDEGSYPDDDLQAVMVDGRCARRYRRVWAPQLMPTSSHSSQIRQCQRRESSQILTRPRWGVPTEGFGQKLLEFGVLGLDAFSASMSKCAKPVNSMKLSEPRKLGQ